MYVFAFRNIFFISNKSGEKYGPDALTISPHGHYLAFIGPQNFTVTVVSTKTLDEVRSGHRRIKSYLMSVEVQASNFVDVIN